MKKLLNPILIALALALPGVLVAPDAAAIDPADVRDFDEVFVISATAPTRDRVEVRWDIEDGYYLYNNKFLQFRAASDSVVLGAPEIPPGKRGFDELLGEEVEKYYHQLVVGLPIASLPEDMDTLELRVRSQGCLEDELCYPPSAQVVTIDLPPAGAGGGQAAGAGSIPWRRITRHRR